MRTGASMLRDDRQNDRGNVRVEPPVPPRTRIRWSMLTRAVAKYATIRHNSRRRPLSIPRRALASSQLCRELPRGR
eukprot:7297758-Pyramimonas_sp.AAC.1